VHVRAVEKRVAFRQNRDHSAGFEVFRDFAGRFLVEIGYRGAVVIVILIYFRCDGVDERQFHALRTQVRADDGARIAVAAALRKMRDHVGLGERAHGFQRQQFGIAGPGADADKAAFCLHIQRPGLASALTAAAVMALPPRRPRTMA
jgi:hypothetical protein